MSNSESTQQVQIASTTGLHSTMGRRPKFSVVVPTRNRPFTLPFTLESILTQDFEDYELIVCDNCSVPETRELVAEIDSARLRYIRSDVPLAMSDNWERAVCQASGEYVIVIGDDDALLPHALRNISQALTMFNAQVIRWERVYYSWPDIPIRQVANQLIIPLETPTQIKDGKEFVRSLARFSGDYTNLPMLYNSAVHRSLLEQLRSRTGRVFKAASPDIYSGLAIAWLSGSYLSLGRPMSINAGSGTSNGVATVVLHGKSPVANEFAQLSANANLGIHHQIPNLPTLRVAVIDAVQRVKDELFPNDKSVTINRRRLASDSIKDVNAKTKEELALALDKIRASLSDIPRTRAWFDRRYGRLIDSFKPAQDSFEWQKGYRNGVLYLDASDFDLVDVFAVAEFCGKFFPAELDNLGTEIKKPPLRVRFKRAARRLLKGK